MAAREDRALAMPELPLLEDPIGSLDYRLRVGGRVVADRPFAVAGRRACATGGEARGVDEVRAHPMRVAERLRLVDATADRITMTPLGVERALRTADGARVVERVLVPSEAPVCLFEWEARDEPVQLDLEWTCDLRSGPSAPDPAAPLRWRAAGRGLVVAGAAEERAVFAFSRAPGTLVVEDGSEAGAPRVRARARLELLPRNSVRLAAVGGAGEALLPRALMAARRTSAAARARAGHADRLLEDRLSLEAPDPAVTQALDWAKVRLASYAVETPGLGRGLVAGYGRGSEPRDEGGAPAYIGVDAVWAALACLAVGDFGPARDALEFLGRHQAPTGRVADLVSTGGGSDFEGWQVTPLYLLLASEYLDWTGDLAFVRSEWPRLLAAYGWCRGAGLDPGGGPAGAAWAVAVARLARTAESIGEKGAAVELRGVAERAGGSPDGAPDDPLALLPGAGGDPDAAAWLDQVMDAAAGTPWGARLVPERHRSYDPARPEPGAGAAAPTADRALAAAGVVLPLVRGLLGAEPDAVRGRLVIRLRPPAHWRWLGARRLAVGDARVALSYRTGDGLCRLVVRQERGAVPLTLVLEPSLPGRALRAARVDGHRASLETARSGGRVVAPVQLVLDHARTVELEIDD